MRLIAVQRISSQLPKGALFEASGMKARALLRLKLAAPAPDEGPADEPLIVDPETPTDDSPVAPAATAAPRGYRRGRRSEAPKA